MAAGPREIFRSGLGATAGAQEGAFWVLENLREGRAPAAQAPGEPGREAPSSVLPKEPSLPLLPRCVSACVRRK